VVFVIGLLLYVGAFFVKGGERVSVASTSVASATGTP